MTHMNTDSHEQWQRKEIKRLREELAEKEKLNYSLHDQNDKIKRENGILQSKIKELEEVGRKVVKHFDLFRGTKEFYDAIQELAELTKQS